MDSVRRKFSILIAAFLLTTAFFNPQNVSANTSLNVNKQAEEAARNWQITENLIRCLDHLSDMQVSDVSKKNFLKRTKNGNYNIFKQYYFNIDHNLHKEIIGKGFAFGNTSCGEFGGPLLNLFSNAFKVSQERLVCGNEYGNGGLYEVSSNFGEYGEKACYENFSKLLPGDSLKLIRVTKAKNPEDIIRKIYEQWASTNKFAVSWENINKHGEDSPNAALDYINLLHTFRAGCSYGGESLGEETYGFRYDTDPVRLANDYKIYLLRKGNNLGKNPADYLISYLDKLMVPTLVNGIQESQDIVYYKVFGNSLNPLEYFRYITFNMYHSGEEANCPALVNKINKVFKSYKSLITGANSNRCEYEVNKQINTHKDRIASEIRKRTANADGQEKAAIDFYHQEYLVKLNNIINQAKASNYLDQKNNSCISVKLPEFSISDIKIDSSDINISLENKEDEIKNNFDSSNEVLNTADTEKSKELCFSGAGFLGWLICPALTFFDNASGGLYTWVQDRFIRVEHSIFSSDNSNSIYPAWDSIRSIANILFVIFLFFVIISQLTGFGIDNYGIKKILPRLIIAAIMINLSFLLFSVLVDISNIIGYSIRELFSSFIADPINRKGISIGQGFLTGLLSIAGGGAAVAAVIFNPAIILTLFISVITGFFSILILWLILVSRQVVIIILAVVSPIAFAAYILPNTKKFFEKWVSLTKAMLVVFPVCSLVFGASELASEVLGSTVSPGGSDGDVAYLGLGAMLVKVLPYMLIPSIIKNSLIGLNNLGGRISGLASKAYRVPNAAYRQSDFKRRLDIKSKAMDPTSLKGKLSNSKFANSSIGRALGVQETRARQLHAYNRQKEEEGMSAYLVDPERQAEELKRINSRIEAKQVDDEISSMADSTGQYNTEIMQKQLSSLLNKGGKIEGRDAIRAKALMKKLATSSGFDKKQLTSMISGITSNDGREFIARYAQKNSDVGAAISQKSGATGQYLRDVASGYADNRYKDMGLTEWLSDSAPGRNGQSNESFVANTVLSDDSDFLRQSSGEVARNLALVDNNRIQNMINNRALMESITDKDIKKHIVDAANQRGLKSDYIGSDVKTIIIPK